MDVRLSPEQQALREAAASMVDRLGPKAVRDLDDEERAAKLDSAVEGAGWRELRAAGEGSEPLASAVEACVVAEEMSRGLADAPFVGPTLAADLRRRAGAAAAADAETILLAPGLAALADGDGAGVAFDAARAGAAVHLAGGLLVVAPVEAAPQSVDLTRPEGRPSGSAQPLAGSALPASDLAAWTALGLALTSADLVGVMRGAVALATDYASSRRQYGAPIGSFQAVQHLLADAHVATEGSRSVALHAAWAVDALAPDEAVAAGAVAKAYCARAARRVCETVIQVHGGIGNTWECLAHLYLRRALLSIDVLGGVGANLDRVLAARGLQTKGADHGLR